MARQVATAAAMLGALLGFAGGALPQTPPANAPSTLAPVAPAAPATVTLPTPGMAGSLAFSAIPNSIDVGPLGKWYVDGVLSGLGLVQSNHVASDTNAAADMSKDRCGGLASRSLDSSALGAAAFCGNPRKLLTRWVRRAGGQRP